MEAGEEGGRHCGWFGLGDLVGAAGCEDGEGGQGSGWLVDLLDVVEEEVVAEGVGVPGNCGDFVAPVEVEASQQLAHLCGVAP